jgi:hypothetical protein
VDDDIRGSLPLGASRTGSRQACDEPQETGTTTKLRRPRTAVGGGAHEQLVTEGEVLQTPGASAVTCTNVRDSAHSGTYWARRPHGQSRSLSLSVGSSPNPSPSLPTDLPDPAIWRWT